MRLAALLCALAAPAAAAEFSFCWTGAGGYTMTGRIVLPDAAMTQARVTEAGVTAFAITGYRDGARIGSWDMEARRPGDTFHLNFLPETLSFPTGGNFPGPASQGWNADGEVTDCGPGGFGFNSGNYAQDVCLDGVWIADSSIDPATPLVGTAGPVTPDCTRVEYLSLRTGTVRRRI